MAREIREMREEDARNSLVYFMDTRDGKDIRGLGIHLGPGLPKNTQRVFLYFYAKMGDPIQEKNILLDENNPLITIQKLSFADFLIRARHILELARRFRVFDYLLAMPDLPKDVPLSEIDFDKDADVIAARLESGRICHTIDWLSMVTEELMSKGVTEF